MAALALLAASAPGAAADCRFEAFEAESAGRLDAQADGSWTWQARPGDRVRCDAEGHEPLDVACDAAGCQAPRALRLSPGRPVEVRLPSPAAGPLGLVVEWRRFGAWGEATELVASRRHQLPPGVSTLRLRVAAGEDRLLRLRRDGGAPETFYLPAPAAATAAPAEPVVLETALPARGGEIFGFLEPRGFAPSHLRLAADPGLELELEADRFGKFSHSGLDPGDYELTAVFAGGLEEGGRKVTLEADRSAELVPWQLPAVGALELYLGPDLCQQILGRDDPPHLELSSRQPRRSHRLELPAGGCGHRLEGLVPAEWQLVLRRQDGAELASADLTLEAGETTSLELEVPRTSLEGSVRIADDQPLPDLELRATRHEAESFGGESPEPIAVAVTDAEGHFLLDLPGPGRFDVGLVSETGFPILDFEIDAREGANRRDIDLGDAMLRVRLVRIDGGDLDEKVTLELWRAGGADLLRTGTLDAGADETVLYDLVFERYEVAAFTESGWVTIERPVVELSKSLPIDEVELILDQRQAVATILDQAGRPVPGLVVAVDQRQIFETPGRPGEYSLQGASAGSELRVQPPPTHVPVCRMLRDVESVEITLRPATAEAYLIPPAGGIPSRGAFLGTLEGLPGSNCAMPISFMWQPFVDEADRDLILLRGLSHGTYLFRGRQGVSILQVPGPPVPMSGGDGAGTLVDGADRGDRFH